jgi:hypothetical protein
LPAWTVTVIDLEHRVEPAQVDDDPAVRREARALRAGAAAPRRDGRPVGVGDREDLGDLLLGLRPDDDLRAGDRRTGGGGMERGPVRVGDVGVEPVGRGGHEAAAQRGNEGVGDDADRGGRRGPGHPAAWLPNPRIT